MSLDTPTSRLDEADHNTLMLWLTCTMFLRNDKLYLDFFITFRQLRSNQIQNTYMMMLLLTEILVHM